MCIYYLFQLWKQFISSHRKRKHVPRCRRHRWRRRPNWGRNSEIPMAETKRWRSLKPHLVGSIPPIDTPIFHHHSWCKVPQVGQVLPTLILHVHGLDRSCGLCCNMDDHHHWIHFWNSWLCDGIVLLGSWHIDPWGLFQFDCLQTRERINGHLQQHWIKYLWHFGKDSKIWCKGIGIPGIFKPQSSECLCLNLNQKLANFTFEIKIFLYMKWSIFMPQIKIWVTLQVPQNQMNTAFLLFFIVSTETTAEHIGSSSC